jgi:hypothetical protein
MHYYMDVITASSKVPITAGGTETPHPPVFALGVESHWC